MPVLRASPFLRVVVEWHRSGGGLFGRLDMDGDMGGGSETLFQGFFDVVGAGVCGVEREVAVHADVQLDGVAVADASGAKVVGVLNIGEGGDDGQDFAFDLLGQ